MYESPIFKLSHLNSTYFCQRILIIIVFGWLFRSSIYNLFKSEIFRNPLNNICLYSSLVHFFVFYSQYSFLPSYYVSQNKFQQVTWNIPITFPLLLFHSLIALGVESSFVLQSLFSKNLPAFFESSTYPVWPVPIISFSAPLSQMYLASTSEICGRFRIFFLKVLFCAFRSDHSYG